ncbi:MAG TPA: glycosyltransferase family 2 protein [bacterium]|nr:glycosyltransferase family 2 protein [bacterium]
MTAPLPFVSVILVCRNEERHIGPCLDSLLANDYPADRREILVVDGMSTDSTRRIVEDYARRHAGIRLLDNPGRTIPAAMNLGIAHARGEIILKMDAHSTCPPTYIGACVRYLMAYGADNVGGVVRIVPGADTLVARTIARVLAHPFGSGNAYVKVGAAQPRWADTAAFGCYRKAVFERVGPWNERLAGSSDLDMNARLRAAGGRILLVPAIEVEYRADRDLRAFWSHNFADGVWATYVLKFGSRAWSWRHWIPLAFLLALLAGALAAVVDPALRWGIAGIAGAYVLLNFLASLHLAWRARDARVVLAAPGVFALRHLAHGLGALWGLVLAGVPGVHWKGRRTREA